MLSATASGGNPPYSYSWSGRVSGSGSTMPFSAFRHGSYTESVTVTDSAGHTAAASCGISVSASAPSISPTGLEINLAATPIDKYFDYNADDGGNPILDGCSTTITVQQCLRQYFQSGANNWVAQGVTGVRFFFTLAGGWYSMPFDGAGNVTTKWRSELHQFFADLKTYGIQNVTPTPVLGDWSGNAAPQQITVTTCGVSATRYFVPWLPYGYELRFDQNNNSFYVPDQTCDTDSYARAAATPDNVWWGWDRFFNVMDTVLAEAYSTGLGINSLDWDQEHNLSDFTVMARTIYDNTHSVNVLQSLQNLMRNHNFDPSRVIPSVVNWAPEVATFDCGTVYGDSAMLLGVSSMLGALAGPNGKFGSAPNQSAESGLWCAQSYDTTGMTSLPVSANPIPTSLDIHTSNNYPSDSDTVSWSALFHTNYWKLLENHNLTGSFLMFGETNPIWAGSAGCSAWTATQAQDMLTGYLQSDLFKYHSGGVVMRPFHDINVQHSGNNCLVSPNVLNPPYNIFP